MGMGVVPTLSKVEFLVEGSASAERCSAHEVLTLGCEVSPMQRTAWHCLPSSDAQSLSFIALGVPPWSLFSISRLLLLDFWRSEGHFGSI